MNLQLDEYIYRWLFSLDILSKQSRKLKNGKIEIPLTETTALEIGHSFLKLFHTLNNKKNLGLKLPPQNALKVYATPQDKLYNWNLLSDLLKTMGFTLNVEMKRLIVSGNTQMMNELLKELYDFFNEDVNNSSKKINSYGVSGVKTNQDITAIVNTTNISKSLITNESILKDKQFLMQKESIDISKLDINKPLERTDSLLELLIVSLSRSLNLKPTQTLALFTNNTKYLAHVISKGVKGDFSPIIRFLTYLLENMETLIRHLENEETKQYLFTFLNILKPALVSKDLEVARFSLAVYKSLSEELYKKNILGPAWDWFIGLNSLNSGLHAIILCLKRHPDLCQEVVDFLKQIGQGNLLELFTSCLKNTINDDKQYLFLMSRMFEPMVNSFTEEEILSLGILEKWIEFAQSFLDSESFDSENKVQSLCFLTEVWLVFPNFFENDESKATNLINSYKKCCKRSSVDAFVCIINLFRLLESFGKNKDAFAPIVYKTLTFILVENAHYIEIRTLIMNNLVRLFADLESIPLSIVIEPWVKQIQVSGSNEDSQSYVWNIVDFEFMKFIALNEKLTIKNSIQILDILSKVFLNDLVYSPFAIEIMMTIINRFLDNETLQEFLSKLIKISLAIYFASEKKRKNKANKEKIKVSKPNPTAYEFSDSDLMIISAQKNALIVKFLKDLAQLKHEPLNEKLKPLVAHTNLQLKKQLNMKTNDKGMLEILSLWGNADKISAKYENDYFENLAKEKMKKREEELRSQLRAGLETTGNISQISATSVREIAEPNLNHMSASFENKSPEINTTTDANVKTGEVANASTNFEKGLRSQGIGYKNYVQKSTLTKSEQMKMALLRNPKADPKILNQLKELAQVNKDKNQSMIEEFELQKSVIEKQKVTLRKQLEKRAIEQGIAHKNLKDIETNLIFPLDSREKELAKEKKHGLFETELIYMPNEEERDIRFVEAFFRSNNKILKYLFVKYCNLSTRKTKPDTFEKINAVTQRMTATELWKLLRDFNYTQYISQDKVESIIRLINIQIFKEKDEKLKSLDFEGFQIFLLNLASLTYSKNPPGDLRHLPPSFALDALIKHFREEEKNKGGSVILFDDPEATIVADSEVLKEFNKKLEEDPEYVLPEGYKKVPDIKVKFNYKLCETLSENLPENFLLCYEVLNDFCNEKLGFCLYEPLSVVTPIFLARPKIMNPVSSKVFNIDSIKNNNNNNSMLASNSQIINSPSSPLLNKTFTVQPRKRVLEIAHKQPLSFNMKLEIAKFDPKYKYMAEEVAYFLEDLLSTVDKGLDEIPKYQKASNKVMENKLKDKSLEHELKEKKEQKRKMRHHLIKQQMKEKGLLPENEEKRKELMKKRHEETKKPKTQESEAIQKKKAEEWEKRLKQFQEEKKKNEEEKKKKVEEEIKKNSEDQQKKEQEKLEKQKKFKEFNRKAKEKYVILFINCKIKKKKKNKFNEISTVRKKSKEKLEKQEETQKAKVKAYNEKMLPKILEKTAEQTKKEKEFNELLKEKLYSEPYQQYLKKQEPTLKALFAYLIKNTYTPLDQQGYRETIPLKTLLNFCNDFEVCPLLLSFNEVISTYNSMIKAKSTLENQSIGINYQEFIEILFRAAAKSHHILNKISDYMKISGSLNEEEKEKINQGNEEDAKNDMASNVTALEEINKLTVLTLNGLLFYLGLPIDPLKKEEVVACFKRKSEKKEAKTNKKKKMDLQKKLDGEGYENSPLLTKKEKTKKQEKPKKEIIIQENNQEENYENNIENQQENGDENQNEDNLKE